MDDIQLDEYLELDENGDLNLLAFPGSEFDTTSNGERAQTLSIDAVLGQGEQTSERARYPDPTSAFDNANAPYYGFPTAPIRVSRLENNASHDTRVQETIPIALTVDGASPKKETLRKPQAGRDARLAHVAQADLQVGASGAAQGAQGETLKSNKRSTAQPSSESNKRSKLQSALAAIPTPPPPKPRSGTTEWVADRETFHAAVGKVQMRMPENNRGEGRDEFDEDESATLVDRVPWAFEPYPCRYRPCPSEGKRHLFMTVAQRDQHEIVHKQSAEDEGATLAFEPYPCRIEGCTSKHKKLYTTPSARDKHEKIHNDILCKPCRRHYSSQEQLDQHRADNHANGEKCLFSCDLCEKQYYRKDYVTRHVKAVHLEEWERIQEAKRTRTQSIASSQTAVDPTLQPSIAISPKLDPLSSPLPTVYLEFGQ